MPPAPGKQDREAEALLWAERTSNRLDRKRKAFKASKERKSVVQSRKVTSVDLTKPDPQLGKTRTMRILADSREQRAYAFGGPKYDATVERVALPSGDYSLPGFEDRCSIERKELGDLVSCLMGSNRTRFEKELTRLRPYECKAVVVEASMQDVRDGNYRSEMKPHAVLQSVLTFQVRYGVPFIWCGSREGAEYVTYWTLAKYAREIEERHKLLTKSQASTEKAA